MKRICKQCGREFELTDSEMDFYRRKQLEYPKRCKSCRELNRKKKNDYVTESDFGPVGGHHTRPILLPGLIVGIVVILVIAAGIFGQTFLEKKNSTPTAEITENFSYDEDGTIPEASPEKEKKTKKDSSAKKKSTKKKAKSETSDNEEEGNSGGLTFRYPEYLQEHYEKHGIEMGFSSPGKYLARANKVIEDPASLHKLEAEDGDDVYYLQTTNDFVIVSTDGYIRTYFRPKDGIEYFNRQ